jgi:hypothetical protein
MKSLIENVAVALVQNIEDQHKLGTGVIDGLELARIAIAAMRQPSHAMCVAGDPNRFADGDSEAIWTEMIDIALEEVFRGVPKNL